LRVANPPAQRIPDQSGITNLEVPSSAFFSVVATNVIQIWIKLLFRFICLPVSTFHATSTVARPANRQARAAHKTGPTRLS
jgi:hypothetical protein